MKRNFLGKIAYFFISQFEMALLIMLLIVTIGIFGFITLPKESLPEIILPTISIQGIYPGASPESVETLLVDKIETALTSVDNIEEITSDSRFGLAFITVNFIEETDIDFKKLEIDSILNNLSFPDGVTKVESSVFRTSEIPLMNISVSGETDIFTLTTIGEDIADRLEQVPAIESVTVYGGLEKEIHIIVNHIRMLEYGVTFNDVRQSLRGINVALPLGALDLNGVHYNLKVDERLSTLKKIENVLVKTVTGNDIFIRDFATVVESSEEITSFSQTYSEGRLVPSVFLEVVRKSGADVIGTSKRVKEIMTTESGRLYPSEMKISYANDLSESVGGDLENIEASALSGLIVVILVLFLFIGIKEAMVVSITIPLSLLATIGVLNFFDMTFNTFVVLGLIVALGLLVDNSIIVMENISRYRLMGKSMIDSADIGTNQVSLPILAATLTTLAAFFPLAILSGTLGDFVSTIPITIMITLVMSLIVSITITPTLSVRLLKPLTLIKEKKRAWFKTLFSVLLVGGLAFYAFNSNGERLILGLIALLIFTGLAFIKSKSEHTFTEKSRWVKNYHKVIKAIIYGKWQKFLVLLTGLMVFLGSFSLFGLGLVQISFFPQSEPDSLSISVDAPGGVSLEETSEIVQKIESLLIQIPEIDLFNTTVGGDEIDKAVINIAFKKEKERSGFDIRDEIEEGLKRIPGAEIFIETQSQGPPIDRPIVIKIVGSDLEDMTDLANTYKDLLTTIEGVYNVELSSKTGVPQLLIDIKERKALSYGLSVQAISDQIRGQVEGIVATTIEDNREEIDIRIKKSESAISDKKEIENLYVASPTGVQLPVSSLAELIEVPGVSNIRHEDRERVIFVEADLRESYNINAVIGQFNQGRQDIDIADDIYVQIGGDIEGIQDSFLELFQSMILAVFLVFIILTVQFRSIAQPFVILLTVPMAIIGVLWGLAITQNDFGFYAFMALVALVGIAVNDAIVLIDYANQLRVSGKGLKESIIEAGVTRINPVLATTMTTISGVLPLAFRDVYYAQFSFSLVFGLLITTILTLVFIPLLYVLLEGFKLRFTNLSKGGPVDENK